MNQWQMEELNVQVDHVHLLVQLPPKESVSHAVQLMKGGTSRVIRTEFPELDEFLWGNSLWADGYFAESVGQVTEARMRAYIQNQ
jgi:putative transposase